MISAELRFEGFDSRSWTNLISLFAPSVVSRLDREAIGSDAPEVDEALATDRRGVLVIVLDDRDRVLKALQTQNGRVKDFQYEGSDALEQMANRYHASRCVVLREGVMEEIGERIAIKVDRGDDYLAQLLVLARTIREMSDSGLLLTWPRPLGDVPIPTAGMVQRALDIVFPDEHAILVVAWSRSAPWTALVLRRRGGLIDLIAGPDLVARWTGPLGGDWRRDYRVIGRAVERAVAPVHVGIFTERSTLTNLLREYEPGAWAKAIAVRDVIIHPTPPYVAVAAGADAVRRVAQDSARWLGGLESLNQLAPLASYLRSRVAEVASVTSTLGFDPLTLLAQSLRRAEALATDDEAGERAVDTADMYNEFDVDDEADVDGEGEACVDDEADRAREASVDELPRRERGAPRGSDPTEDSDHDAED